MDNRDRRELERELNQAREYLDGALDRASKRFILDYIRDLKEKIACSGKINTFLNSIGADIDWRSRRILAP
jgi:hypothetical protein